MAISFPPECDTPLKRLTFCRRVHRRLLNRHAAVRQTMILLGTKLEIAAFKAWEQDTWVPRMKRCNEKIAEYRAAAKNDAEAYQIKLDQQTDTTWDYAIDTEAI